jgi:hyperosmotically inducible periplasmic protein
MQQHRIRSSVPALLFTGIMAVSAGAAFAQPPQTPPDNTKVNTRDRAKGAVTADQQKENAGDRELTQKIRKSLMADKSLSTYAHNVKVVAQGGQVTLKGPVRTEEEKRNVEAKAVEVAGAGHVVNEISIAPAKRTKK